MHVGPMLGCLLPSRSLENWYNDGVSLFACLFVIYLAVCIVLFCLSDCFVCMFRVDRMVGWLVG